MPKKGAAWSWKKICETKDKLKVVFTVDELRAMTEYSVKLVYNKLVQQQQQVNWGSFIWNRLSLPKHRFIAWLAKQNKLQTTEKLAKIGLSVTDNCLLCGSHSEGHAHLFFECHFSKRCLPAIKSWLNIQCVAIDLGRILRWIKNCKQSQFRKKVFYTAVASLIYKIWQSRNESFWLQRVPVICREIRDIKFVIKYRVLAVLPDKIAHRDKR